jgi:HEAT repeat protein
VGDPRWYVVRNVVGILARTHDPSALPYLERTLRHNDERVRRETIRALMGIRDALAAEMLTGALADEDAQNVQIAARYLGVLKSRGALAALHEVALGQGKGNRESGPRTEAIETIGRIGSPESVSVLGSVARQRGFLGGRQKELRAAAAAALEAIRKAPSE